MESKYAWILGILLACFFVVNYFWLAAINTNAKANYVDEDGLVAKVVDQIDVPTAAEIAAEIPPVEIPEVTLPDPGVMDNEKIDDLWEDLYADEIEEIEEAAYDHALAELEDDDYEILFDWLEAQIEGFDELEDVDVEDYEIEVANLGLEEDEDKEAVIEFELEVEYTLLEGMNIDYKKQVLATATVLYEEGDFDEEEVNFVFT
jgi:predicted outer membrane lipoprotein